jgi:FkbM family methyltransferase
MTCDQALALVGRDDEARAQIVAALRAYEQLPDHRFTTVRDDITGPIVDALHGSTPLLRKSLSSGLVLEFPYRSKIARDFVMSTPETPDHVWEPQTTRLLLHFAASATEVIVGGAYFGDQAIPIADALRGRGRCHAFEPNAGQAALLGRNAALNGLSNLVVEAAGLWSDTTSRLELVGDDALGSSVVAESGSPAVTIDSYAETAAARIDLIMLDLEGAELPALRGAERVLGRDRPHVIFEIHRSYVDWSSGLLETQIGRYLTAMGYRLFCVRDFQSNYDLRGRPIELVPAETAYLEGPPHGFNVLAVSDVSVISQDPFTLMPGVSPKLLLHRDPALHHPAGGL